MTNTATHSQVAIIGSGFGGLGMGYRLAEQGISDYIIFESAASLGGTWRENTYPGAACDVPSYLYCYSFERHYPWQHRYAKQAEILSYMNHCADKYDIGRHIRFGRKLIAAHYDTAAAHWQLEFADGSRHIARMLVSAIGQLSQPSVPALPGAEAYLGERFHSARWNHDAAIDGKTVAVVGNGASAIQLIPAIADRVKKLYVFQRSPGWVWPKHETPVSPRKRKLLDAVPLLQDIDRWWVFMQTELLAHTYSERGWLERVITWMVEKRLRDEVADPALRARLRPDYPIGCKRMLLTSDWLATLARDDVQLVTAGLDRFTPHGLQDSTGTEHRIDAVVWATGFQTTRFMAEIDFRGLGGKSLAAQWVAGAEAYLGMAVSGFPNFFMLFGPNSNTSGSILFMLEQQQRYVARMAHELFSRGAQEIDVHAEAQQAFVQRLRERSARSTYAGNCRSWFKNEQGVNTNNWIGTQREYARSLRQPQLADFRIRRPGSVVVSR